MTDDSAVNAHPDRSVAEWMGSEDLTEQKGIEVDIAGSKYNCSSNLFGTDNWKRIGSGSIHSG
jgi:hypothetical protein